MQGGFIWDFVDQSIRWKGKDGVDYLCLWRRLQPHTTILRQELL